MANNHTTLSSLFTAIADEIRSKTGSDASIIADQFPAAIAAIDTGGGGITPTGTVSITENGTYDVTNYSRAEVNVPQTGITPSGSITIAENGTHDVTNYASAEVNVEACGQYIWEKSKLTEWGVTSTDFGKTKPSDCGSTLYGTATITDDGHYTLSGSATLNGYYYINGAETNPKSVYYRLWHYVHNGDSYYTYEKRTISDEPVSGGGLIGYVVSDDETSYPDGGTQDGYWYVRVTVQEA